MITCSLAVSGLKANIERYPQTRFYMKYNGDDSLADLFLRINHVYMIIEGYFDIY
jgi:hypothetical protein